jgi:MerR family gold-responsive transcriptional activator of gol and ges genes
MNIQQAAGQSGLSAKMIRHYELIGLVPKAKRSLSNYRRYEENDVHVLRFIRRARDLGFSTADIKELLGLWRNKARSSAAVKRVAGRHLGELKRKIAQLEAMASSLEHLMRHCHGDHRPDCPILEDIAKDQRS